MLSALALATLLTTASPAPAEAFAPLPGPAALLETLPVELPTDSWPNCAFILACPAYFPGRQTEPDAGAAAIAEERVRFAALIRRAHLLGIDEADQQIRFAPTALSAPDHQPGLLEDVAIEAAIRNAIAADPLFAGLHFRVECHAGCATIHGEPANVEQALELTNLALGVDNLRQVSLELPPGLRLPAAESGTPKPLAEPIAP